MAPLCDIGSPAPARLKRRIRVSLAVYYFLPPCLFSPALQKKCGRIERLSPQVNNASLDDIDWCVGSTVRRYLPSPAYFAYALDKILQVGGRMVSLTVSARLHEAILAILLGQRQFRQNNAVSGMGIMSGFRESGLNLLRADTILAKYAHAGIVVAMGRRKSRRYRLSTDRVARAEQIARHVISQVPQAPRA